MLYTMYLIKNKIEDIDILQIFFKKYAMAYWKNAWKGKDIFILNLDLCLKYWTNDERITNYIFIQVKFNLVYNWFFLVCDISELTNLPKLTIFWWCFSQSVKNFYLIRSKTCHEWHKIWIVKISFGLNTEVTFHLQWKLRASYEPYHT